MNEPTVATITGPNLREGYGIMLDDSITLFLKEFRRGGLNYSTLESIFKRLLQRMTDPPIEILFFHFAVLYHSLKAEAPLQKSSVPKQLYYFVCEYSARCNALKKVSALAPIIFVFHNSINSLSDADALIGREIESLMEKVVGHIRDWCPLEGQIEGLDNLTGQFSHLMQVWMVDRVEMSCNHMDLLRVFFPLLSDEVRLKINVGCRLDYLAGVVMNEIFLLMLQLKLGLAFWERNLRSYMGDWAIKTIKGFQNCIFFDMLLRMMLEPSLPLIKLLSSEQEVFLRKVLYDAVLLGEFSFLKSGRSTQLPEKNFIDMSLAWLLNADKGIQFVREHGEKAIADSYIIAFSKSDIPNLLVEWFSNQTGVEERVGRPNASTPGALIKWLLVLEDQGIRVFGEDILTVHAIAGVYKVSGDQEMVHLRASACEMNRNGRRKREGEMNEEAERNKIVKYNYENSVPQKFLPLTIGDALNTGNRINALVHGNEMENAPHDNGDERMEDVG